MKEFLGSISLLFCFMVVVIGPFLLPKVPRDKAEPPLAKPQLRDKSRRGKV
jgi:hypothetical protein